jgi:hypothetical protein
MYIILAVIIATLLSPIWIPIAIWAGLTSHWTDTVPRDEDL